MLGTSALRLAWSPACVRRHHFDPMYRGLDAWFEEFAYKVGPGSGAANCRDITGGDDPSLHSYFDDGGEFVFWNGFRLPLMALAVDINPAANPYGPRLITDMPRAMIDGICGLRTNSGHQMIQWGGYFGGPYDAMHFQGCCTPAQMATGIRTSTLPKPPPPPPDPAPAPPSEEDEDMPPIYIVFQDNRDPATNYSRYADVKEKPLVPGEHCYAVQFGGTATYMGTEAVALAKALTELGDGTWNPMGDGADQPEKLITTAADGKKYANAWFMATHCLDGPLAGIKK